MTGRRSRSAAAHGFTLIEILVALLILGIMSALGYGTYRAARISAERTEESLQRTREIEFGLRTLLQDLTQAVPRPVRDVLGSETRLPAMRGSPGAGTVSAGTTGGASTTLGSPSSLGTPSGLGSSPSLGTVSGLGSSSSLGSASSLGSTSSAGSASSSGNVSGFGGSSTSSIASILDITRAGWSNTAGQQRGTLQRVSYALVNEVLQRSYQSNLDTVLGNKPLVQDLLTKVKGIQLRYLDQNQAWQNQWPPAGAAPDIYQSRPVAVEVVLELQDWGRVRRLFEVAG